MKESIRSRARELGFDLCRFTSAAAPASAGRFRAWLDAGRHGTMHYLERTFARRIDLRQVLPDARSVITLAVSYFKPDNTQTAAAPGTAWTGVQPAGVIARYARFTDYHELLSKPLAELSGFIETIGPAGTRARSYVDTGPLLERDLAQRGGLGFIGKHTNLISRSLGNWLLLAEIITTLPLEPDRPETNRCGTCARCLAACPTGALPAPFELDARRCISYLTIEWRGAIPIELRPLLGARIFGCDDCLAVCPWNRFAREGALLRAGHRADLTGPALLELLLMTEDEFRRRHRRTPLWRVRYPGFRRNVCVALGNVGTGASIAPLRGVAEGPDLLVADHAAWAIQRIRERTEGKGN